jgi:DNA topoisomerase-3
MARSLIITEKPSVAADIAKALGKFTKDKDYYESDTYIISWAVGHLFELAVPEEFKAQDKWSLAKLPLLPTHFDLEPEEKMGPRVRVLSKFLKAKDVDDVINACDAGREGELIFRYIYQYAKSTKPIRRLWLQSMTPDAIRDGFKQLKTDDELQPLAHAARSRNEADWIVGINATRAFTLRLSGGKGSSVTSLGRVQTPTLALIVEREKRIQEFKERALFEVFGHFDAAAGLYAGRWFDESFKKEEPEPDRTRRILQRLRVNVAQLESRLGDEHGSLWDEHRQAPRLWLRELADAIDRKCAGKPGVVELEEKKPTTQICPQLYDLTTLQREANNRFGLPAKRTLQIAQALYEKHKAITYPRTDSRCLPEDYIGTVKSTLRKLDPTPVGPFAARVLEKGWVHPNKRIFNNAKVSDHFAIIPTGNVPSGLDDIEASVFEMISKRFVAIFFPPAEFEVTTRITRVEGEPFKTEGKIMKSPGWLEVYGRDQQSSDKPEENLPAVNQGERVQTQRIEIKEDKTKPPARYNEGTILSAMEGAGKLVDDEELREAMKERGLGTPATRAQIIENLIAVHYLQRHGKELQPTAKAIQTITLLKSIGINELVSPETTGEWEHRLREIERKQFTRDAFMTDIRNLTASIVEKAKHFTPDEHVEDSEPFGECPKCHKPLVERFKSYSCTDGACDFSVWKTIAGRLLTREEFDALMRDRKIGPLAGFRSKAGKRFNAIVKLNDEWKTEFDFEATVAATDSGIKCEKCGKPMVIRSGRRGEFLACSGYPECKTALNFKRDEAGKIVAIPRAPQQEMPTVDIKCEKCSKPMAIKMSRRGPFLACTGYPKCKNAKPVPDDIKAKMPAPAPKAAPKPTDEKCELCGAPMVIRQGRFGEFLGCSAYPKCKNIRKTKPTSA